MHDRRSYHSFLLSNNNIYFKFVKSVFVKSEYQFRSFLYYSKKKNNFQFGNLIELLIEVTSTGLNYSFHVWCLINKQFKFIFTIQLWKIKRIPFIIVCVRCYWNAFVYLYIFLYCCLVVKCFWIIRFGVVITYLF